jgi:hypothetical protein
MFCPECKAEYRAGFTHCADCDVDLVATQQEAMRSRRAAEDGASDELATQVWHGTDPHFYLGAMEYLAAQGMPHRGRAVTVPEHESFEEQPMGAYAKPEFEIRVSKENSSLAQWMLESWEEKSDATEAENERILRGGLERYPEYEEDELAPGQEAKPKSECPLCGAEFEPDVATCPNCAVRLRTAAEKKAGTNTGMVLSSLPHPGFHNALRKALARAGIPFDNAKYPNARDSRLHYVSVLSSDFEQATDVMAQLLQYWEFGQGLAAKAFEDPRKMYWSAHAEDAGWFPEDLTAFAWEGKSFLMLDAVGMALREHEIVYRVESPELAYAKVFVHPEDEANSRAILKEVAGDSLEESFS